MVIKSQVLIDQVQKLIDKQVMPGASFTLVTPDDERSVILGDQGQSALASNQELVYDLASVSKVVGVATVMIDLIDEQKIDLDVALSRYYPDWEEGDLTIRQLLTHTSGLDPFIPNRDSLDAVALKQALNRLTRTSNHHFHYTDVNFLLLGFMLETYFNDDLAHILKKRVFDPLGMQATGFGPVAQAVLTSREEPSGIAHDPKARVLGPHAGSAGLFAPMSDLVRFVRYYFAHYDPDKLLQNYNPNPADKPRSLGWDLHRNWLLHTGYTGTFIMMNLRSQVAAILLSNRVLEKDDRLAWIADRDVLIAQIRQILDNH